MNPQNIRNKTYPDRFREKRTGIKYPARLSVKNIHLFLKYKLSFFLESYFTKPDFIIVGAQKAGTSSLYKYVTHHPSVKEAAVKEIHYFDIRYSKPENWYKSFFPLAIRKTDNSITGEASPYYLFHPYALERIAAFKPNIKIITMLRDPVERAVSHYYHERRKKREPLDMLQAFKAEEERLKTEKEKLGKDPTYRSVRHQWYSYKSRGEYITQLKKLYSLFPEQNILILESGDFFRNPQSALNMTFNFLGIEEGVTLAHYKKYNSGRYSKEDISQEAMDYLKNHFKPWNHKVFEFLGRKYDWI